MRSLLACPGLEAVEARLREEDPPQYRPFTVGWERADR